MARISDPRIVLALVCAVAAVPASAQVFEVAQGGELKRIDVVVAPAARRPDAAAEDLLTEAAEAYDLSPSLLTSVARQESNLDPAAVSPRGARGVMQLMPATARSLHVDPRDPAANVFGGAAYLRALLDQFGGRVDLALAAYNAGPGAVSRHRGLPPYPETRTYVARNLDRLAAESLASPPPPGAQP